MTLEDLELTISVLKGNLAALEMMNDTALCEMEETEYFKDLTEHNLTQIFNDLRDYLNVLLQAKESMIENGGELPDSEPSIAQQRRQHDPDFESALSDVFGGYNLFG